MKSFGSVAYVEVPKYYRLKFDSKAEKGISVGYVLITEEYRVWLQKMNKIVVPDYNFQIAHDSIFFFQTVLGEIKLYKITL